MIRTALVLFLLFISPALADPSGPPPAMSAISMQGAPKYPADFTNLAYVNPMAPQGGTLRLAASGSFDNLNPYSVRGNKATGLNLTGESLLGRSWDEPFALYGLIAESIKTPPDRSWVEFSLNPKAHWNDGTPITVQDVLFSWQQLRDHGRPNHRTYYSKVSKGFAVNDHTVRFEFDMTDGGDREMPLIMGLMPILCKAWWQGRDVSAPSLDIPVTSGPYKLTAVEPGRKLTYTRDANYWGNGLPFNKGQWNFAAITYDYYRDDSVALEAFKAGAYDLRREQDPVKWLSGYNVPAVQNGEIIKLEAPNQRPEPVRGFIFNTRHAIFADVRVREALTNALDFEWMNKALFGGIYHRASSVYPNSELAAKDLPVGDELSALEPFKAQLPPQLFSQPFTLPHTDASGPGGMREHYRHAVELLKAAGWQLKGGQMQKDGTPLSFEILLSSSDDEKIALEFARSLKRIGITASVRTVDSAQYQARMNEFDFDMTVNFWSSTLSPGNEQVYYWGSAAADQPGSRNYAGIKSPVVDALAGSIASSSSRAQLVGRARALDRVLMWGHYIIPLYYLGRDLVAYRSSLQRPETTAVYGVMPEQTWWFAQ